MTLSSRLPVDLEDKLDDVTQLWSPEEDGLYVGCPPKCSKRRWRILERRLVTQTAGDKSIKTKWFRTDGTVAVLPDPLRPYLVRNIIPPAPQDLRPAVYMAPVRTGSNQIYRMKILSEMQAIVMAVLLLLEREERGRKRCGKAIRTILSVARLRQRTLFRPPLVVWSGKRCGRPASSTVGCLHIDGWGSTERGQNGRPGPQVESPVPSARRGRRFARPAPIQRSRPGRYGRPASTHRFIPVCTSFACQKKKGKID